MVSRPGLKLSHGGQKMSDVVRYSEAFKLRLVEDVAAGKYAIIDEARRRNGIRGGGGGGGGAIVKVG
jgi:hypothetical protein